MNQLTRTAPQYSVDELLACLPPFCSTPAFSAFISSNGLKINIEILSLFSHSILSWNFQRLKLTALDDNLNKQFNVQLNLQIVDSKTSHFRHAFFGSLKSFV